MGARVRHRPTAVAPRAQHQAGGRSVALLHEGDRTMSNRKPGRGALPNGRSRTSTERYMILHYWMLESPAWQSLSPAARALYLVIRKHFNGHNNGQIHLSRDLLMHELGVGSEHTSTARDQLLERGFLKITSQGGFDYKAGARAGRAHTYELTELEMPGRPASKEFMSWRPAESLKQESFKGNRRVQKVHRTCAESAPVEPLTGAESAQPCAESAPVKPVFGHSTGAETAHIVILPCRDGRSKAQAPLHSLSDSPLHGEAASEALDEVKKGGRAKNRPTRLDGHLPAGKR